MEQDSNQTITPTNGKLGVLLPGVGAVASTFIAGVLHARKFARPIVGSVSQLESIDTDKGRTLLSDALGLAQLDDLVFAGWDPLSTNALEAARTAGVLNESDIDAVADELAAIEMFDAVFSEKWVSRLKGERVKSAESKWDQALALEDDIERFAADSGCERMVMVWCGSTEAFSEPSEVHMSLDAFEEGLKNNDENIAPSQIYAYAALRSGVSFANGAPNLTVDVPWAVELAQVKNVGVCGKDFKTGQTLMKTLLAPGLRARMLGLRGWYSTNILGNRDGQVLDAPENFKTKESSKLGVLDSILEPEANPELYGDAEHVVRINYFGPRGDNKEGWDAIDIFGWMGYDMGIRIDFMCRDSILAAPLVLDLALFMDLAQRSGEVGCLDWLAFYFKAPQSDEGTSSDHDLFVQQRALLEKLTELSKRV